MSRPVELALRSDNPVRRKRLSCINRLLGLTLILTPTLATPAQTAVSQPPASLESQAKSVSLQEPGRPIERQIAAGETHSYQLTLAAGQYVRVAVAQRRINVAVAVFGPDGKKIADEDWFAIGDSELVSVISESEATYRLEVRAPEKPVARGSYEIKIKELRAATERDKNAVAAERLLGEGLQFALQPAQESWRKGIEKYQQSIPYWQAAKDLAWEATALYLIGYTYIALRDKQKAFEFLTQALPIAQASAKQGDAEQRLLGVKVEAMAFNYMGQAYFEFGDKPKALEMFRQALAYAREIVDHPRELETLNQLASTLQLMGDLRQSLDYLNQGSLIVGDVGDLHKEANLLNNICVIKSSLGEYKSAIEFCNQAIAIRRELKDSNSEATVLNNLGGVYSGLGEYQKALDSYTGSYAIHKTLGSRRDQGIALNNIAFAYGTLGEYQRAFASYSEALEIFRALGDDYRQGNVLGNIAANYADQKDYRKSLEINQEVLRLRRAVANRDGEAVTLNNIAGCYQKLGDRQKALDYYQQSIAVHRTGGNMRQLSSALNNISTVYRELAEYPKALEYLNEGLQISRTIGDRGNEAASLSLIAGVEGDQGNLTAAKARIDEALAAVESLRVNVKSQKLRASFFAKVRNYHEFNIDLLMRLHEQHPAEGFDVAALQASETGRARSLLEMINEGAAEIRQGVDPALVERERVLRQTISDKAEREIRLLAGKHTEEQAVTAAREINLLTGEYEQLQAEIRQTSPRYAALTQPAPLSVKEIQAQLLDENTVLLEYALGEKKSFGWIVTPASIKSFELPPRAEIEQAARRVYDLITATDLQAPNESPEQKRKRLDQADAEYPAAAGALSRILLAQVASEIKNKRLLIVGEGLLQYVPFAALPEPVTAVAAKATPQPDMVPLIVNHEIVSLPSASVLGVLRQESRNRQHAAKKVAVFADPVFDVRDSRIALARQHGVPEENALAKSEVKRAAAESGLNSFARLRFSRQEAEQIVRLASDKQSLEAVDFAANRTSATSPNLGQYGIVHFATHGLINNQHPELSGIVLSLVDEKGEAQNGFLRLYDIYNLNLKADLVVLSACQTALGKDIKGEGLVGLTRAFMYAGATRVVASLWQTEDRGTAVLMNHFYEGMFAARLSPAAALRNAQVSMAKDKRWRHPRYWAAFTLQGEWQ